MAQNTEVRIFLSSTFCDLQEERSLLVNKIMPAIKSRYARRGLKINIIDLRWGVTEEESRNGKVLGKCLREIQNARPYFVGILGGRYGWIPAAEEIRNDHSLSASFPEVLGADYENRSITEMEIQFGFFNNANSNGRSLFFLKDMDCVPEEYHDTDASYEKLMNLRGRILDNASKGLCKADTFTTAESLGELFYRNITELLDKDFPPEGNGASFEWIYNFQLSRREYDSRIAGTLGINFTELSNFCFPNQYNRIQFICGHPGNGIRNILADIGLRTITIDSVWKDAVDTTDNYYLRYQFIPIDIDPHINTAEKLLGLMLFIYEYEVGGYKASGNMEYGDYVKAVRGLRPDTPVVCIIRDMDNLPASEIRKLAFIREISERMVFIISCKTASFGTVRDALGLDKDSCDYREYQPALNIAQCLHIIDNKLDEWSKALSPAQRFHLLLCPSLTRLPLLNLFLETINRFGYYERLDEIIDRFVKTRSDEEFTDVVLDMFEQDFGAGRIRWLLSTIASDNGKWDEEDLKEKFAGLFGTNSLEWASYSDILDNFTEKVNSKYLIQDIAIKKALAKRYCPDLQIEGPEDNEDADDNSFRTTESAYHAKAEKPIESPFIDNLPDNIQDIVPYIEVRWQTQQDRIRIVKSRQVQSYQHVIRTLQERGLLDDIIVILRKSETDDSLITLLWIALTEVSEQVTAEEIIAEITDRIKKDDNAYLRNALRTSIDSMAKYISPNPIYHDGVQVLHILYEWLPELDFTWYITNRIANAPKRNIYELPQVGPIYEFAIKWLDDGTQGRLETFIMELGTAIEAETDIGTDNRYIEFLKQFSSYYKSRMSPESDAYKSFLKTLENKFKPEDIYCNSIWGGTMLSLGYNTPSANIAVLESSIMPLGNCALGSDRQKRFFRKLHKLHSSYSDYQPSVEIRFDEILNLLLLEKFEDAAAVSRTGFDMDQIRTIDFLETVLKGDRAAAADMIERRWIIDCIRRASCPLEVGYVIKSAALLVMLYRDGMTVELIMEHIDDLWILLNDNIHPYYNENLWPLRKMVSAIFLQRMGLYADAEELFRQACLPLYAAENSPMEEALDIAPERLELLGLLQSMKNGEFPEDVREVIDELYVNIAVRIPGILAFAYLTEKIKRLKAVGEPTGEIESLAESIKLSKVFDLLMSAIA